MSGKAKIEERDFKAVLFERTVDVRDMGACFFTIMFQVKVATSLKFLALAIAETIYQTLKMVSKKYTLLILQNKHPLIKNQTRMILAW